jgi:voltage-gated potassium channel
MSRRVRSLEWAMAILALLVVPALILEDRATDPALRTAALVINWTVWLAFVTEFIIGFALAGQRRAFLRAAWLDLAIIVVSPPFVGSEALQGTRSLRLLRVLRLVRAGAVFSLGLRSARRAFGHRKFHYVGLFTLAIVVLGAFGVYLVERGENKSINSVGDALWWAIVTATTVGYGDVSPVTSEGRVIAVMLMLTGIGAIGVFTATVASFFLEPKVEGTRSVEDRLTSLERKLDELLAIVREPNDAQGRTGRNRRDLRGP